MPQDQVGQFPGIPRKRKIINFENAGSRNPPKNKKWGVYDWLFPAEAVSH
jgi:hypothetical protein